MALNEYRRSRNGKTVHKSDCKRAKNSVPWKWANGMPEHEIRVRMLAYPWLTPCKECFKSTVEELVIKAV